MLLKHGAQVDLSVRCDVQEGILKNATPLSIIILLLCLIINSLSGLSLHFVPRYIYTWDSVSVLTSQ